MAGVLEGVDGVDTGPSSFVLEEEATVLRAKLGRPDAVLGQWAGVSGALGSVEVPTPWAWAWARALIVDRHIFSSGGALGIFRIGLALGLRKEGLRGVGSRAHLDRPQAEAPPLGLLVSSGGRLECRRVRLALSSFPLTGVLWSRRGRPGSPLSCPGGLSGRLALLPLIFVSFFSFSNFTFPKGNVELRQIERVT